MNILPWVIGNLLALIFAVYQGYDYGRRSVQVKWDAEKAAIVTAQREKEALLQANMDKLREDKRRETAKLRRTVAALTDSLRNRPERPAVPASATDGDAGRGCTGAELYREDAELVVAESERAEIIRIALKKCQDAYREASD